MKRPGHGIERWAPPLAAIAVVCAADLIGGADVSLISLLILGPLLASFRLGSRQTAVVGGVALAASVLLGIANDYFGESSHLTRILPVAAAAVLCVWLSRLRRERERAALLLALQGSVSRVLNESPSLPDAAPRLLRVIGESLDWKWGALWEVDRGADVLRRVDRWSAPGVEAAEFERAGERIRYERGVGVPGRVWESGAPASLPEVDKDPNFPRARAAAEAGLDAAFAFPIRAGDSVVGVIEFFDAAHAEIDPAQLEMLTGLGRQIGQYVERSRGEEQRADLLEREHGARMSAEGAERRAAETVALLDTLLARAPAGFAFIDTELRYVRVNDALAAISGHAPADMVGRRVAEMLPQLPEVVHGLGSVIRTGEPVVDAEISGETSLAPGIERHWLASYYPVRGLHQEILGVGAVVVEITDRKRAEVGAAYLAEATAALSASLDYEATLHNVARLSVPHLADWCAVQMLEPDAGITTLAVAHADPAKERLVHELNDRYPPDPEARVGSPAVIRTGESQLYPEIDDALLQAAASDDTHLKLLRDLGLRSGMTVPLVARGRPLGALTFASAESGRTFGARDLALAEELGHRAGAAIENARLYRERSHIAQTLQASLLPPRLPDIPGAELAARYRAAGEAVDVGGDFYDVFPTGDRRWAAVVGDVLGKGPSAAAMIGLTRHTLRTAAMRESDSVRILATLNEALCREGIEESFCTALYATIEACANGLELELTSAGHPLPLVLRADGSVEKGARPGTVLGAVPELALDPYRVTLAEGDALVIFTDGVLEARSEDGVFGEEQLRRLLQSLPGVSAQGLAERVERDIVAFQAGEPRDDLAVLVVRSAAGVNQQLDPGGRSPGEAAELEARERATS
ncbi:MAG: SpoIIE family protein phosphatase [Thermoleophilaceae bacterium]|nr:SpoIIE family protein phosphatase [Thermoleophilaceae bacterium]